MQIGSTLSVGTNALAFAALNRLDSLNWLVDKLTSGRTNRDTLAQKVLHDAVNLGLAGELATRGLGERTATIVPLASKILFSPSSQEMGASIKQLTHEIVGSAADDSPGIIAAGRKAATEALANTLANTFTETQFSEKLLATMAQGEDGLDPLEAYMKKALSAGPLTRPIVGLVMDLVRRAVASQPELDQSERPIFRLMAGEAKAFLTTGDFKKPLSDYFTESVKTALPEAVETAARGVGQIASELAQTAVKASEVLIDGYAGVKDSLANEQYAEAAGKAATTVYNATATVAEGVVFKALPALAGTAAALTGITVKAAVGTVILLAPSVKAGATTLYQGALSEAGRIYQAAAGPPAYIDAAKTYAKDIEQAANDSQLPALPAPDARTSDSEWANALARQQSIIELALPDAAPSTAQQLARLERAFAKDQIDATRKQALADLTDKLSPAQLAPLGPFSATHQVAHDRVSGHLSRLASQSQALLPLADGTAQAMAGALDPSSSGITDRAGYKLGGAYAAQVGQLALDFPEGVYSYADASRDSLQGAGNLWWGENITLADRAELRKLYNTCGGSEQQTLAVSRYLDPGMAFQALAAPVLAQLDPQGTGLLQLQPATTGLQLRLADSTPEYRYQLRREGENVQVTISATWDIAQYGTDAQHLRSPQGAQDSQLSSSVTITVPAAGMASHGAPALQCAIRNEFQFSAYGQLEEPIPAAVRPAQMLPMQT